MPTRWAADGTHVYGVTRRSRATSVQSARLGHQAEGSGRALLQGLTTVPAVGDPSIRLA